MTLYLSRLRLRRDLSLEALSSLLAPQEPGRATDANHWLIWSAFAGEPDRKRDFLWRAEGRGAFYVLSVRPPAESPFFDAPDVKRFAPDLRPGDRLTFVLRANATRTRKTGITTASGRERKQHIDLVMDALFQLPPCTRAEQRMGIAQTVGVAWLARQGEKAGFAIGERVDRDGTPEPDLTVADYSVVALPGQIGKRQGQPQFGVLEMTGTIEIVDPTASRPWLRPGPGLRLRAHDDPARAVTLPGLPPPRPIPLKDRASLVLGSE